MRTFQVLDKYSLDDESGVLNMSMQQETSDNSMVAFKREGGYVAISASHGPLEIALRPRLQELTRVLARLRPVEGLQMTRQVGTGQAYLGLGLGTGGELLMRPTIVADATGHLSFNITLSDALRAKLFEWLPVVPE